MTLLRTPTFLFFLVIELLTVVSFVRNPVPVSAQSDTCSPSCSSGQTCTCSGACDTEPGGSSDQCSCSCTGGGGASCPLRCDWRQHCCPWEWSFDCWENCPSEPPPPFSFYRSRLRISKLEIKDFVVCSHTPTQG